MYKFALTVDDVGVKDFSSVEDLTGLLDLLKKNGVRATFFVTPFNENKALNKRKEWVEILSRALEEKHELALHGYRHEACEFGIPPDMILEYEKKLKARIEKERAELKKRMGVEILTDKIEKGMAIFEKSFGIVPEGFRSPFLAVHKNLFRALIKCRLKYDSSVAINPRGWKYIAGNFSQEANWYENVPCKPYRYDNKLWEIPLMTEYTWFLKENDFHRNLTLARQDMKRCFAQNGVFVPLCHVSPVKGENLCGYKLYENLFERARNLGEQNGTKINFCTLTETIPLIKS